MIAEGSPVRVKLMDESNHAGVVVSMDDKFIELHCVYKFVSAQEYGLDDQVEEVLLGLSRRQLMVVAADLGVERKVLFALVVSGWPGVVSVLSTAMMDEMEPMMIAQQSPVNKVFPMSSVLEISSLVDEGQEKLFERWAST